MKITPKKLAALNIIISLIAAGAIMLFSAYWPNSFPNSMYVIIAVWSVPFGIINGLAAKK